MDSYKLAPPEMTTKVLNLATGEEILYSIPPERAVVAAYEQFARKNWNTWGYPEPGDHPQYVRTPKCHTCGDFTALAQG